jgi:hypothetical protein
MSVVERAPVARAAADNKSAVSCAPQSHQVIERRNLSENPTNALE